MSRPSPAARRDQIVQAALKLLSHTPLDQLSTRQIAAEVGISQPALFRHFPTRAHILAGAVAEAREQLEVVAARVLTTPGSPLDRIETLATQLFSFIGDQPWLPRLLFHDVGHDSTNVQDAALRHLVSMQRALVGELVRSAQAEGSLPASLDAAASGAVFVALLQGALLQRRMSDPAPPPVRGDQLFAVWSAAAHAGLPPRVTAGTDSTTPGIGPAVALLDVRPIIKSGEDPLQHILAAVKAMPSTGAIVVHAPFRPTPLLTLLGSRGHRVSAEPIEHTKDWRVFISAAGAPPLTDLRELEAPEPLEHILHGVAALEPGAALLALTPRVPRLLLGRLATMRVAVCVLELDGGAGLLHVRRPQ
jgi:TetR/AcrR family transcriptional regulator